MRDHLLDPYILLLVFSENVFILTKALSHSIIKHSYVCTSYIYNQSKPTYYMSVFFLPHALCLEINLQMRKFWWDHQENKSQVHWMSWGCIGLPKESEGMGFRDFTNFNKVILAKQA